MVALLKQWLNQMRGRDDEAARRFQALRRETRLAPFLAGLHGAPEVSETALAD